MENAAALTYTTLFAVVPLMTVTYSMLSAIPTFQGVGDTIQSFIFDNFVPTAGAQVESYLKSFSQQARKLTAVGVLFLIVTAFMMLRTIDSAINQIWQVNRVRRGVSGFLLYWAILSLGPLLLGLGFVLTSYLASLKMVSDTTAYLGLDHWLLRLMPVLLSTMVFTLLYSAVPNRKVPIRHAISGALFVAVTLELAKAGFALFISLTPTYELVYGAFAAVPLFLLWIYLSWVLVLFGAVLVRNQALTHSDTKEEWPPLVSLLVLLQVFREHFLSGHSLGFRDVQKLGWPVSLEDWEMHTGHLVEQGVIYKNDQGELLLGKDLRQIELSRFCEDLPWPLPTERQLAVIAVDSHPAWFGLLIERLQRLNEARNSTLAGDLDSLFTASNSGESCEQKPGGLVSYRSNRNCL